uniref:Metalloendopeptidase n=1 Tax=Pachycerianthus borealis TaxID=2736680 RepID=A0A7G7WYQ0_9CNID|nr:toxin candidate TRINITY_DN29126_c0_g3_i1 [Pachycerianthus borealis]
MKLVFVMILMLGSLELEVHCNRDPEDGEHFEGDIILTANQRRMIQSGDKNNRAAIIGYRWPNGVVPYRFHRSISRSRKAKKVIFGAMKEWSDTTCITFKRRRREKGFIQFYKSTGGCSSYVGYHGVRMRINLAEGCWHHGIVVHEIGHALGFFHEQSRLDRDKYVRILWQNIAAPFRYNFMRRSTDSLGEPYDYNSIMHYRKNAFSWNGLDTIQTLNGAAIGQRSGLSNGDIKQMNLMYRCSNGHANTTRPCPNEWLSFGDHCYFFSTGLSSSWQNAQQRCQSMQADLLCVTSNDEWTFIKTRLQLLGVSRSHWIGPNDIAQEGAWVCGGQNLTFTWWYPNQPNNYGGNENCAAILHAWYNFRWSDDECTNPNYQYICKASSSSI